MTLCDVLISHGSLTFKDFSQLAGAVEYTNCFSAEGVTPS